MDERPRWVADDGLVHIGLLHSRGHVICDYEHEIVPRLVHCVKQQHPTCLWCALKDIGYPHG